MDDAFLRFLDQLEAQHQGKQIEHRPQPHDNQSCAPKLEVIDAEVVELDDTKAG
jgi:hypothetical protein